MLISVVGELGEYEGNDECECLGYGGEEFDFEFDGFVDDCCDLCGEVEGDVVDVYLDC